MGMAAAALYIACLQNNEKITQKEIAEAAGVTEVTVRNRYKALKKQLNLEIPDQKSLFLAYLLFTTEWLTQKKTQNKKKRLFSHHNISPFILSTSTFLHLVSKLKRAVNCTIPNTCLVVLAKLINYQQA